MGNKGQVLNEAEVDFLLAASAASQEPPPAPPEQRDAQTVTMRGDLEQINLADIFQTLAMSKMEGLLLVRNPLEERQVYCNNGTVRIRVPARLSIRRLGQRLVQAGLLDTEQLRATLVLQRTEQLPLGALLVKQGLLTQDKIDEIAGMQVAEDLFALFTWKHGSFEFYKGELTDPDQRAQFEACPEFEVNSLLLEVARRSDEWESILAAIGSLDEVPQRLAEEADESTLSEVHHALLYSADAQSTYRDLATQTTYGLFEAARAARDLVSAGLLGNIPDERLVAAALEHANSSQEKRALLLLQTLRDRPGERSLEIIRSMSDALELAGERRLAGTVLLEAAQLQTEPFPALELARRARDLAPNDAGTISFLRTTLLAHSSADSAELEKCTLDLLDALIEADLTSTALEIVQDARATGTLRAQILVREARARQKSRDTQGAVQVLIELSLLYQEQGERHRAIESLEAVLRLDRSRKDIQKQLSQLRQTRTGRIIKFTAMIAGSVLFGGMGFVFWQQNTFEAAAKQADAEISALLANEDRAGARERLAYWQEQLGDCEPIEDLVSRIAFDDAAEKTKFDKIVRKRINDGLTQGAGALDAGDIDAALGIYQELWRQESCRTEVVEVVATRLGALLGALEQAAKTLVHSMPPQPSSLFDRHELTQRLADINSICPPKLLRAFTGLRQLNTASAPEFVSADQWRQLTDILGGHGALFVRAGELTVAYTEALQRNDLQRRLDPLFKSAVEREAAHDFKAALDLYRQLESEPASDDQLRAHFRDQVARNGKIWNMMTELQAATTAGQFALAQQHYRALKLGFPGVPFERLVRLPVRVESRPPGATITCNGKQVGQTPLVLSIVPGEQNLVSLALDDYRGTQTKITGDAVGEWIGHLVVEPDQVVSLTNLVEVPPATDGQGRVFFVDRGGSVTAFANTGGKPLWAFSSGDLSGLLSQPLVYADGLLVASLDGELRVLDRATGTVEWTLPKLATETTPAIVDKYLLLATTDRRLHLVSLDDRSALHVDLPELSTDQVLVRGRTVVVAGAEGTISAFTLPGLTPAWQRKLPQTKPWLLLIDGAVVAADDGGRVHCLDLATGEVHWSRELETETLGRPAFANGLLWLTTPEHITRLDHRTGTERDPVPRPGDEWAGAPLCVGERLLVPVADGAIQVLDLATQEQLYRLDGSKRGGRVLVRGESVFVVQADRKIHWFGRLR